MGGQYNGRFKEMEKDRMKINALRTCHVGHVTTQALMLLAFGRVRTARDLKMPRGMKRGNSSYFLMWLERTSGLPTCRC